MAAAAGSAPIRVSGLRKVYDGPHGPIVAVDGIDLEIASGEFFGLLGPNGAGKSTTIGMLTTRVVPTGGPRTSPASTSRTSPAAVKQRLGVVAADEHPRPALTVRDNLVLPRPLLRRERRDARGARRRAARAVPARRPRRRRRSHAVRRHGAAADVRPRAGARARGAVPRRADGGHRPADPDQPLGDPA